MGSKAFGVGGEGLMEGGGREKRTGSGMIYPLALLEETVELPHFVDCRHRQSACAFHAQGDFVSQRIDRIWRGAEIE